MLLMTVTGVLMFFEIERGLIVVAHQWFSWLFLIGVAAHIAINIRPFKSHFKSLVTKSNVIAFAIISIASFFSWGMITGPQLKRPIELALVDAPLSALASVARTQPEVLVSRFKSHGVTATNQQSIREIAHESGVDEDRLLAIIFLPD
jgi:hypothetical protein